MWPQRCRLCFMRQSSIDLLAQVKNKELSLCECIYIQERERERGTRILYIYRYSGGKKEQASFTFSLCKEKKTLYIFAFLYFTRWMLFVRKKKIDYLLYLWETTPWDILLQAHRGFKEASSFFKLLLFTRVQI